MNTSVAGRNFCLECGHSVRGSLAEHIYTKAHAAAVAAPVIRRHKPRREVRALRRSFAAQAEWSLDDPAPTWKLCAGVPSLEVESHMEPVEAFHSNVAYSDGLYVRCHSCHQFYLHCLKARKAAAA